MKRHYVFALAGAMLIGTLALIPVGIVSAQTMTQNGSTFIQKLAAKLGLSEDVVQQAVNSTHDELRDEMEVKHAEELTSAVEDGKLTQRQSDLLNAVADIRQSLKDESFAQRPADLNDLTHEERQAQHETLRNEMDQKLVDALNANGLNTTIDELREAMTAGREAGIGFGMGRMHGFGPMM